MKDHGGKLPRERAALEALPGIGPYTAGAVRAFAFGEPEIFIETNIRRVFIHFFFPNRRRVSDKELLPLIKKTLEPKDPRAWYFALMDYGAMLGYPLKKAEKIRIAAVRITSAKRNSAVPIANCAERYCASCLQRKKMKLDELAAYSAV